jgi:hypothetical protein
MTLVTPSSPQPTMLNKDNSGTKQSHPTHNAEADVPALAAVTSSVITEGLLDDADDVALSADGICDHDASYQERFCFDYREPEWLLVHPTGG